MKLVITTVLSILLTGCVGMEGPKQLPTKEHHLVKVNIHTSLNEIEEICGVGNVGCAVVHQKYCVIHYMHNNWNTFAHEMKHCYYGSWHQ